MSIPFTWIYLIHDSYTDLYKIGKSDDPARRLHDLKRQSPTIQAAPTDGYELLEAWLCPVETESELHQQFRDVRTRGEWFALESSDESTIRWQLTEYRRYIDIGTSSHESAKRMIIRAHRYFDYTLEYARQIRELQAERDSLLRQRAYLVSQRRGLSVMPPTVTEIEQEEAQAF